MRERPILFNAPMVRALLDGSKTQTRRAIALPRKRESFVLEDHGAGWWPYQSDDGESSLCSDGNEHPYTCPYGQPGDRLWVRESVSYDAEWGHRWADGTYLCEIFGDSYSTDPLLPDRGIPSIHLPRRYSRITLEITSVRVERLRDVSEADVIAEGCLTDDTVATLQARRNLLAAPDVASIDGKVYTDATAAYRALWEQINGAGSWVANPWVWVVEFKKVTQ